MLQPLAIAVIGGILISMVLSLIVTPAIQYFLTSDTPRAGLQADGRGIVAIAMRILLVEDEPSAAHVLAKGLREQAYAVDRRGRRRDGALSGRRRPTTTPSILDVMLPRAGRLGGLPRDPRSRAAPCRF